MASAVDVRSEHTVKVAIHSFMSIFQLILLDPPKLIIALSNLVNNPISPIKSLNQMSNNKITSFKVKNHKNRGA